MRKVFSVGTVLLTVVGLLSVAPSALAADGPSVKLEPGVAIPLTQPQSQRFDVGGSMAVKGLVGLTPWLDVGPTVSLLALPSTITGIDTGTAWGFGGTVRVKRPHDRSNEGTGFSAVSPWADADLQYVRTGALDKPGMTVAVGAAVPTSDTRNIWIGPFARYQGVFTSDKPGYDSHAAKVLILGLSVELGPAHKPEKVDGDADNDGTPDSKDRCPYVPGPKDNFGCPLDPPPVTTPVTPPPVEPPPPPPVVPEVKFQFTQRVQFAWDSEVILPESIPGLKEVVQALLKDKDLQVRVEGHASSEGQVEHNNKLSQRRANSVVQFLVVNGVDAKHLKAVGFGSSVPVADNATEAGRVANRRVEFNVNFTLVKGSASK